MKLIMLIVALTAALWANAQAPKLTETERVAKMYAAEIDKGGMAAYDFSMFDKMLELAGRVDKGEISKDTMNALMTVHKAKLDAIVAARQEQAARQDYEATQAAQAAEEKARKDRLAAILKTMAENSQRRVEQLKANRALNCTTTYSGNQADTTCR